MYCTIVRGYKKWNPSTNTNTRENHLHFSIDEMDVPPSRFPHLFILMNPWHKVIQLL